MVKVERITFSKFANKLEIADYDIVPNEKCFVIKYFKKIVYSPLSLEFRLFKDISSELDLDIKRRMTNPGDSFFSEESD